MSFHGITSIECNACGVDIETEIRLVKEATKEEWQDLWSKITSKENLCKHCKAQI